MNRPKRPSSIPPRRRPTGGPPPGAGSQAPRRRTALDLIPATTEPRFQVLGGTFERQSLHSHAQPMELVVIQGFTREIEDAFQRFKGRPDDFWPRHQHLLETARKLDEIYTRLLARRSG